MTEGKLDVHLVTPEREVWTGEADFVLARTTEGDLGILVGHAPLLGQLQISALAIESSGQKEWAAIDGGFLHVKDDRVDVLGEHAEMESEIDPDKERSRMQEAESKIGAGDDDHDDASQRAERDKAQVRLGLGK